MAYARNTEVSADRSRAEIETLLRRAGAKHFQSGWKEAPRGAGGAFIMCELKERTLRFLLKFPATDAFRHDRGGRARTNRSMLNAHDQEVRRLWRALLLVIKAKLEAVDSGIETLEHAFLANIVLPDDRTVGEHLTPKLAQVYAEGRVQGLLPDYTRTEP